MSTRISLAIVSLFGMWWSVAGSVCPAMAQTPPTITITGPTDRSLYSAGGAAIALEGSTTGTVTSISWRSDRGPSGLASGTSPWYAPDVPLVNGVNVLTVTATGPGGTATDTITIGVGLFSYILAEGATGPFFDLDIAIANPNDKPAPFTVTFYDEHGPVYAQEMTLPPTSSTLICADCIPALKSAAVSTVVNLRAPMPLIVERTMRWSETGQYGSHTEKAIASGGQKWYFAEGSQGFFSTYLLLTNLTSSSQRATVDWLIEGAPPVRRTYDMPSASRLTVDASADPALVNQSFGIVVTFESYGAAERAMYFGKPPDVLFKGGHESAGVQAPSTRWFLPEGATGAFFETFILLANPNDASATATLRFLPAVGAPVERTVVIPAHARRTVNLEALTPPAPTLADAAVATVVDATLPIVVERAQYWPFSPAEWYEAHNSFGLTATSTRWGLAEGRVGNPAGLPPAADYQTYILLANPGTTSAHVAIKFLRRDGTTLSKAFTVSGNARTNIAVAGPGSHVPELIDETFGAVITSDQPIVVERAMYSNAGGLVWSAGTNATATRLPEDGVVFEDTFSTPGVQLDRHSWTTEIGPSSFLGRTQLADWMTSGGVGQFIVGGNGAELALQTFNPTGFSLYGTHGKTLRTFQPANGATIEFTTRLQLTSLQKGIVYGMHLYGCQSSCGTVHDEIDIELLTNALQPGGPLQVQLNRYASEPLGAGNGGLVALPAGFDPLAPHDWTIRWSLNRIDYLVDGVLLSSVTDHVPQGPMQVNAIAWGPDTDWSAAFDASLQPVNNVAQNQRFVAYLKSVTVKVTYP